MNLSHLLFWSCFLFFFFVVSGNSIAQQNLSSENFAKVLCYKPDFQQLDLLLDSPDVVVKHVHLWSEKGEILENVVKTNLIVEDNTAYLQVEWDSMENIGFYMIETDKGIYENWMPLQ